MKRKVFITGISSEIMSRFAALLNPHEFEILGLTRNAEAGSPANVKLIVGDIQDVSSFAQHLQGCDTFIHAAAITHSFSEKQYFQINLEATKRLVDLAKKHEVKNFVFVSSNTAGKQSGSYGLSKLQAEAYIQKKFKNWVILRPSEIFGGTKKEGIEELINNVMTKSLVLCPLGVPTDFYPIHMDDAAKTMCDASFDPKSQNTIQLIVGQKGYSFLEVLELVKNISKKSPKILFIRKSWVFLIRKILRLLPFSIGIIPDQVDRLYAEKETGTPQGEQNQVVLEDYIKELVSG